jgi:Orthopoxvirus protein of unknown function (DUF830).
MEHNERKIITVLLTRYYSTFSDFIYWMSGKGYTHASLSLDVTNENFYSFNFNGFCIEHPKKHKRRSGKSVCYRLEITPECYEKIKDRIEKIESEKDSWYYSKIGIFLCLLRIPHKRKKHYFCSQFVADMINLSENITLKKNSSLYLPNHLNFELENQSCLKEIVYDPI